MHTGTVTVRVDAVNDVTTVVDDSATTNEDAAINIDVIANDTDVDSKSPVATVTQGANGTVEINADGTVKYTPNANFNGTDTFTYTNTEGNTGTVTVRVDAVNDVTTVVDDSATTNEDAAINIDVIANDTDVDSKSPVATVTQGANGTVEINADGTVKYTPNANFNGTDTFTYTNTEGNTGTVTVRVDAVNDAPDAIDDTYLIPNINGLVGEYFVYNEGTNADGPNLENLGMVSAFIDGRDPDATFVATSIDYGEINGNLGSDGTLQTFLGNDAASLNTDPANSSDAIIKLSGSLNLEANTTYYFRITSDDGFSLSINGEMISEFTTNRGLGISTGEFTTQNAGEYDLGIVYWDQAGQAVLKVEVSTDGTNYNVLSTDNLLLPINNTLITDEDTPLVIAPESLLSNDTDSEGDALTITGVSDAQHGSVVLNNDGTITFTPEENYSGEATFVYTITDSNGGIDTATVSILINPVNDAPEITLTTTNNFTEDSGVATGDVVASYTTSDADGDTVTVTLSDTTNYALDGSGNVVLTAAGVALVNSGADLPAFTLTPNDGTVDGTAVSYDPSVTAVNDAPVASNDSIITNEDIVYNGVLPQAIDEDNDSVTYSLDTDSNHGTVMLNTNGSYTYTPVNNYSGSDSFSYTVDDGKGGTNTYTVAITVNAVADTPILEVSSTSNSNSIPSSSTAGLGDGLVVKYYDDVSTLNANNAQASNLESALSNASPSSTSYMRTADYYDETIASSGSQTAVGEDDAVSVKGLIYLEAGHTYTFSGYEDDTFQLEVGGTVLESINFNTWGNYETSAYTPSVSGYYTIEAYLYNGDGAGAFDINVSIDGGSVQDLRSLSLFTDITDVSDSGLSHSSFVNVNDSDGGYYPVGINEGMEGSSIAISNINATLGDTDGSETLGIFISGIPDGFTLTDGSNSFASTSDTINLNVTGWNLTSLSLVAPSNVSGTVTLHVSALATESSNGSQATTSTDIDVTVIAETLTLGDDNIITNAGRNTFTIPEWALLYNDTAADNITGASIVSNSLDSVSVLSSGDIAAKDNYWTDGTFTYTASNTLKDIATGDETTSSEDATVTIDRYSIGTTTLNGTVEDDIIIDTNTSRTTLNGGDGDDILMSGVGADILNGGDGNDVLVYDNEDTIDGGDNEDILLIQEDITLDFDSVSANISNIEIIDLGTGSQNITISAEDVLDITGSNVLEILGDSSDSVTLSGTWTSTGVVDGFNIYTSNDTGSQVTIKIEEDINNITVS